MNHLWVTEMTSILCHIVPNVLYFGELITFSQTQQTTNLMLKLWTFIFQQKNTDASVTPQ